MPVIFRQFEFRNQNGVEVTLTLEAPVGTQQVNTRVAPNGTFTANPSVNDVQTARVTVVAQAHEEYIDVETINLGGTPYSTYIETLLTRSSIGSIHGTVSAQF